MKSKNIIELDCKNPEHLDKTKFKIIKSGTVWDHTIAALRTYEGNDPVINLSILFHDLGKTRTHFICEKGLHRFFGHENKSAHMIDDIAKDLKIDNKTRDVLKFAAKNHMKFHLLTKMTNKKVVALINDPNWEVLFRTSEADDKSRKGAFNPEKWQEKLDKIEKVKSNFIDSGKLRDVKKLVNGQFVMELLDIKSGPKIGKVIRNTINWILDKNIDINDVEKIKGFILAQK